MAYAAPAPSDLKLRYSAFAAVDDAVVQYWLTDAERSVDTTWIEADYPIALMALAAHNMALQGLGANTGAGALPAGVTRFRSGSMDVAIADAVATRQAGFDYQATRYGQEFARLQRRSFGGPRLASCR